MARALKIVGALAALILILVALLYGYRMVMLAQGRTPEGYKLLTAMPHTGAFEPHPLPSRPILANLSSNDLAVEFGYRVGGISYSYALSLVFPADADTGKAILTAHHASRSGTVEQAATRLWDAPRGAYAVALEDRFDIEPAVPALCIKAVIGKSKTRWDLSDASLCVAQRDAGGACHSETLACGLIRTGS